MGTHTERKTMASRISESPTTSTPKGSSASPSRCDTSMPTAVNPVTARLTPYSSSQASWCARSSATSSDVLSACGPSSGTTWMMPVSAFWFGVASGTSCTPGMPRTSSARSSISPTGSSLVMIDPVSRSGPLAPSPKCSPVSS